MKVLCEEYNIPTASYERFDDETSAIAYLKTQQVPIVIKADGLAAGKGVTVAESYNAAAEAIREIFAGRFGKGMEVVIEEFMEGFFLLTLQRRFSVSKLLGIFLYSNVLVLG